MNKGKTYSSNEIKPHSIWPIKRDNVQNLIDLAEKSWIVKVFFTILLRMPSLASGYVLALVCIQGKPKKGFIFEEKILGESNTAVTLFKIIKTDKI